MERNIKVPVIIEFNGLPGSGKTTIRNALQHELENLQLTTHRYYYKNKIMRRPRVLLFMPRYWRMLKMLSDYARELPERKYLSRILLIVRHVIMYRQFILNKPSDILLIDQGIIQSFVSLAHQDYLPESDKLSNIFNFLQLNKLPIIIVNCIVNVEISNKRIVSRPMNGCRVESMSNDERRLTLETQTYNFELIREVFKSNYPSVISIDINTENNIDSCVNIIMNHLCSQ